MQLLMKVLSGPMMPSKVAWSLWIIFTFGAIGVLESGNSNFLDHSGRYPGVYLNDEGNRKYLLSIRDCMIRVSRW